MKNLSHDAWRASVVGVLRAPELLAGASTATPPTDTVNALVRGLKLNPQPPPQVSPSLATPSVLTSLTALFGVGLLLALGAWRQPRRSIPQTFKTP